MSPRHSPVATAGEADSTSTIGFWIYLMTDCVLFATLFATYAVLKGNAGPQAEGIFNLPYILVATFALLISSYSCGLAVLAMRKARRRSALGWLAVTFLLGAVFLGMELFEFSKLAAEGNGWQQSGFLSAFFVLVGTHGLHISAGMLWMIVLMVDIVRHGIVPRTVKRAGLFSMFWHFLDIIWIFIFTIVYLIGGSQ